jgi:TolB-like protein
MGSSLQIDSEGARSASGEQILALLHDPREDILLALLDNPRFDEDHLCLLLTRKDLSTRLLEAVASRKQWLSDYRVRRSLAFHPHVPASLGLRLVRELYLTDLVQLTFLPSGAPAQKHLAEELILARLPQLPPAQKLTLARRGSGRIAGALLADGQAGVISAVLESPFLNEGQVLKVLSRITVPSHVVAAIAENGRWSQRYNVRLALVRNPQTPLARVLSFLPSLSTIDLRVLSESSSVPAGVRPHLRRELANRLQHGTTPVRRNPPPRR